MVVLATGVAASQEPPQRPLGQRGRGAAQPPNAGAGVALQELQEMFDAFALVQAQRVLQLPDDQYQRFFTRMNRLQDLRRQHTRQRLRLTNELRRMVNDGTADDAALTTALKGLEDLQIKAEQDLRAARAAIDEVLTVRQRARFRFFEEEMERQKIDFMTRARQAGRG